MSDYKKTLKMHSGGGNAWMKIMGIKDKKKGKKEKKGELETLG